MKRAKRLAFIKKRPYLCFDGPFVGSTLWLNTPYTLPLQFGKYKGRYIPTHDSRTKHMLYWEHL